MARIFISYAREDAAAARAFAAALAAAGHDVWWDSEIRAGSRFSREIAAALEAAEFVVVLWSGASVESVWVQDEAAEGLEGERLVPTRIELCKPPLGFRQYQTIDLTDWVRGGAVFDPLVAVIAARAGEPPKPAQRGPQARAAAAARPTICVLPFANRSGDPAQEYFGDGITEDVVTDLSAIAALEVVARPETAAQTDPKWFARELGVTHLLEGSVRKSGSRLRITAQLIEAPGGRHLWAERYDRDISDVFAIQDEIAKAIVAALQVRLLPRERKAMEARSTSDPTAYDFYLKARSSWNVRNFGNWRSSEEIARLCGEATEADAGYALAWALMALAQAELHFWHRRSTSALRSAERATALNASLPEPYCVRARYLEEASKEEEARMEIQQALRSNPDSWDANREAAMLHFRQSKPDEAIPLFEKAAAAMRSDHDSPAMLIACYAATGEQARMRHAAEMAVVRAEKIIVADPANGAAYASAARGLATLAEASRARRWIRKALNVDPGNLAMRYSLASTLASLLDNPDAALDVLEPFAEAAAIRPHLRLLETDPAWKTLHALPRFQQMVARAGKRVAALEPATPG